MTARCEQCSVEFEPRRKARFCSKKCSHANWVSANRERRRESQRRYDQSPKGKLWREQWVSENADTLTAYKREHYEANKDEYIAQAMRWAAENPEKAAEAKAKYAATDRGQEKRLDVVYRRRARRIGASGSFTRKQFKAMCEDTGHICLSCKTHLPDGGLEADHIIPLAAGGSNGIENIQPLCRPCNRRKGMKIVHSDERAALAAA